MRFSADRYTYFGEELVLLALCVNYRLGGRWQARRRKVVTKRDYRYISGAVIIGLANSERRTSDARKLELGKEHLLARCVVVFGKMLRLGSDIEV